MSKKLYLILLLIFLIVGCMSPNSGEVTQHPAPQILFFPGSQEKRLISQETMELNNCGGTGESTQTMARAHAVSHILVLGSQIRVEEDGTAYIPGIGVVDVGAAIASYYNVNYGRSETTSLTQAVAAAPNSHIRYTLQQAEIWETGDILIDAGGTSQRIPYSFRRSFSLDVISLSNLGCSLATDATPTPLSIQLAQTASIESDDQFGDLNITYPAQMRPKSSDRIDVFVSVSNLVASIDSVSVNRTPPSLNRIPFSGSSPTTMGNLETYRANILISENMAALLSSPTFQIVPIYPTQQKISPTSASDPTAWAWIITAPEAISTGILTLSLFEPIEGVSLDQLTPIWVGSIYIEVVDIQPSPTQTLMPSPAPASTLTPIPTATPTFYEVSRDSLAQNIGTMFSGIVIAILTFIIAPIVIERWKKRAGLIDSTDNGTGEKVKQDDLSSDDKSSED